MRGIGNIVFGGILIAGGLSGQFVLIGTGSSGALVAVGVALVGFGLYRFFQKDPDEHVPDVE